VVNAGGYTHTSVALRDALVGVGRPFVEVHLSNVYGRESFRRKSLLAPVALATVGGFGVRSYTLALRGLVGHLEPSRGGRDTWRKHAEAGEMAGRQGRQVPTAAGAGWRARSVAAGSMADLDFVKG
jgi:hypothetical protein